MSTSSASFSPSYALLVSVPVSQSGVVSVFPLPYASSSVIAISSPLNLAKTAADPVKSARNRKCSGLTASTSSECLRQYLHLNLVLLCLRLRLEQRRLVDQACLLLGKVESLRSLSHPPSLRLWCRHCLPHCMRPSQCFAITWPRSYHTTPVMR